MEWEHRHGDRLRGTNEYGEGIRPKPRSTASPALFDEAPALDGFARPVGNTLLPEIRTKT